MIISELRILPAFAVARFGSSPTPLEAFDLSDAVEDPLGYREITPQITFEVDEDGGHISRAYRPDRIRFRDGDLVRPLAPFLEVFAQTSDNELQPLSFELLQSTGLEPNAVSWSVEVANLKIFRQTGDPNDRIFAKIDSFNDHVVHDLRGTCNNFLVGKYIPFGKVRYIRPTEEFPELRIRFTPAQGKVYGSSTKRFDLEQGKEIDDPVFDGHGDRVVYDTTKGKWLGFQSDVNSATLTNPSDIYQGYWLDQNKLPISWGYIDDVCDGRVFVELTLNNGRRLRASACIGSCMPDFAPDSNPIRTVADEIEQLICGPEIDDREVLIEEAAEIVRRALETVRLMNTVAMNGNTVEGRVNIAHTLVTQDTNNYGRQYAPIMASSLVDNLAVRTLHERVYAALLAGCAPWFSKVLRQPEEIGDLSDQGRRKMPPMLRGADGRALALTRRQISKIVKAALSGGTK